jgi:hypothetical protein
MLLGIVALRAGQKIHYDGANMKITNSVATSDQPLEGEQLLRRTYRDGFGLSDTKTLLAATARRTGAGASRPRRPPVNGPPTRRLQSIP